MASGASGVETEIEDRKFKTALAMFIREPDDARGAPHNRGSIAWNLSGR